MNVEVGSSLKSAAIHTLQHPFIPKTMETHTFPYFDDSLSTVHISLFHHVRNAAELRSQLIAASQLPPNDPEQVALNFAFIDAKVIASRQQLLNACLQVLIYGQRGIDSAVKAGSSNPSAASAGSFRTKTVHSEILWALMPGHNVRVDQGGHAAPSKTVTYRCR